MSTPRTAKKCLVAYLVANVELLHSITLGYDLTNELVPTDEARRALEVSSVEVKVGSAQRG
jgi:hypothetical protein